MVLAFPVGGSWPHKVCPAGVRIRKQSIREGLQVTRSLLSTGWEAGPEEQEQSPSPEGSTSLPGKASLTMGPTIRDWDFIPYQRGICVSLSLSYF